MILFLIIILLQRRCLPTYFMLFLCLFSLCWYSLEVCFLFFESFYHLYLLKVFLPFSFSQCPVFFHQFIDFLTIVSRMETIVWCKVSLGYHQVRQIGLINFPQDIPLITVSSSFQPFMANTSISSISESRPDIMCCSDRGYFAGVLKKFQLSGKQRLHIHRFDLSVIRFEPGFQHKQ